jgi:hypothetical protein
VLANSINVLANFAINLLSGVARHKLVAEVAREDNEESAETASSEAFQASSRKKPSPKFEGQI